MIDSYTFTVAVVQTIGDRLATKATELGLLIDADAPFGEWLVWEAFLACKHHQASYPLSEVTAKPTYASEGVTNEHRGDLRVGGPDEGANHCWAFIEFALLGVANHTSNELVHQLNAIARLKQLGWKKSAALLIVLAVNEGCLTTAEVDQQPALTQARVIMLPNGRTALLKAFDCKRDPANILTAQSHP